jgi:hypothetical protein
MISEVHALQIFAEELERSGYVFLAVLALMNTNIASYTKWMNNIHYSS